MGRTGDLGVRRKSLLQENLKGMAELGIMGLHWDKNSLGQSQEAPGKSLEPSSEGEKMPLHSEGSGPSKGRWVVQGLIGVRVRPGGDSGPCSEQQARMLGASQAPGHGKS